MLLLDSSGIDMVGKNIGYNWFSFALTYDDIDYTYGDNRRIWQGMYNQIYSANNVAKSVAADTENPQLQGYLAPVSYTHLY